MASKIKYPIYIPSKGRSDTCLTALFFLNDGIHNFKIVVEPQEYKSYLENFDKKNILLLPENNKGLTYSRLWIRKHSIKNGHKRHWQFDDNIRCMYRLNRGLRVRCDGRIGINAVEEFTDRYKNIGISGFNYSMFATRTIAKPYVVNCHVYSATLINNEMPYKWRTEFNNDVDICLQVVTNGLCTVAFNAFVVEKMETMKMKGGNTGSHIKENQRLKNAQELAANWSEYVSVVWKFNRWHFSVKNGWKDFKHPLIKRSDIDWDKIKQRRWPIKLKEIQPVKDNNLRNWCSLDRSYNSV
tara:strand:- start:39 stop:932 length:894 start_codon:yes stop_codon:yes gene_type:complete